MKNIFKIFTAAVLFLTGCAAPSTPTSVSDDPPVRYARYVQVATYDATPRPPTKKLTILQQAPNGTYRTIATLTINGKLEDEANLINALAWKARQLGADALLRLPPTGDKRYNGLGVPQATHWVFRADAFVADLEK